MSASGDQRNRPDHRQDGAARRSRRVTGRWCAAPLLAALVLLVPHSAAVGAAEAAGAPMSPETFRLLTIDDPRAALVKGEELLRSPWAAEHSEWQREILFRLARAASLLGQPRQAEALAARLDGLAHGDPVTGAYAGFARATVQADAGQVEQAVETASAAAAALAATGEPRFVAMAAIELCDAAVRCGRTATAERHCADALTRFTALGNLLEVGRAQNYLSSVARGAGRLDEAIRGATAARATFERAGIPAMARMMDDNLSGMLLDRGGPGDAAEALTLGRRALAHEQARGKRLHAVLSLRDIARALSMLGRHDEALATLEQALAEAQAIGYDVALPDLYKAQLEIAAAAGRPALIASSARRAIDVVENASTAERERALADAETRYRALEKQREIDRLEQQRRVSELELATAEQTVARQRQVLLLAGVTAASLVAATVLLVLLLRAGRRRERELDLLSRTDSLTGAATRRAFLHALARAFVENAAEATPATLLVLDADEFKRLNDEHGHPAGDLALQSLVGRIRDQVRERDVVGRLGGEEFGIVLSGLGGEEALRRAEAVRAAMAAAPHELGALTVPLTVSVGVAVLDRNLHPTVERWLSAADAALYEAKRNGRNRVVSAPGATALAASTA